MPDMGLAGSFGAAGAGEAIATVMAQRRQAALDQQNQENVQQQMAQTDALTRLKAQEQADAVRQRLETTRQAELDRAEAAKAHRTTLIDAQLKEIPTDTPLTQGTVAGMTGAGILPERFSPVPANEPAPPPGIAAPDAPTSPQSMPGTVANAPAPNRVQFHRIPTAQEIATTQAAAQKTQDATAAEAEKERARQDDLRLAASLRQPSEAGWGVEDMTDANGKAVKMRVNRNTGEVKPLTLPEGVNAAKPTGVNRQTQRQQDAAKLAQGDVNSVLDQVDAAEKAGLLGPGAGRVFGQFLAGTVGSTGDAKADAQLGGLRAAIKDLNGSYPLAISGSTRGGGTDRLNTVLNSDKFSADLMRGALHEIGGALARRANQSGDTPELSADELLKKYGG